METKQREKILLIGAGAALLLWILNSVLITPMTRAWNDRSARITELKNAVKDGSQKLDRRQAILGRWERMRTNTLPANVSQAEGQMLKAVNGWAGDSGVNVVSQQPSWKESGEDYMTYECRVEASGNMRNVAQFLYDLEKDPISCKIDSIEITSKDNNGRDIALGIQVSGLVLNSFEK